MKPYKLCTEAAYVISLLVLALGTALMEAGGFGISMVAAPAYVLHLKLSAYWPAFTFGIAEFSTQVIALLGTMLVVRRAKIGYLFTFVTALIYGQLLDGAVALISLIPHDPLWVRIALYIPGMLICSAAVAMLLRSYLPPAAYELFVKESSATWKKPLQTVKTVYDLSSLVLAILLSLVFFGGIQGIGIGTVVGALVNGTLIHGFGRLYEKAFRFRDILPLRKHFEESEESL